MAFASRSLSDVETWYTHIKKEALASTWACEKFSKYVLGMKFTIESDHKHKELHQLPPRILRFCLRLSRYNYTIVHVPDELLNTADALSCDPLPRQETNDEEQDFESLIIADIQSLPATQRKLRDS